MRADASIRTSAAYFASLPAPRRADMKALHAAIRRAAPTLKPQMHGGLLGYGKYHYRYASGREGDWFTVVLASQKHHLSLYLCCGDEQGYLPEQNQARLGNVSVGKSCIRFRKLADLNLPVAMELVRQAVRLRPKMTALFAARKRRAQGKPQGG